MPEEIKITILCALINDIKRSERFEHEARKDGNFASSEFWHQEAARAKGALAWMRTH